MHTSPRRRLALPQVLLILLCASPTSCTRSPAERALRYIDKAYAALDVARYDEALRYLELAVALLPDSALPYFARGTVYRWKADDDTLDADRDRDIQEAFTNLDSAVAKGPPLIFVYRTRAEVGLLAGMYDRAVADMDTALAIGPRSSDLYRLRGVANLHSDLQQAWTDFDSAMSLDPNDSHAVLGRAVTSVHLGDFARARRDFDSARTLHLDLDGVLRRYDWETLHSQRRAGAYEGRGIVHWLAGRRDDAIRDLKKALELEQDRARARSMQSLLAAIRAR
jgi:tetratricopeptide (TPR) repeat protein